MSPPLMDGFCDVLRYDSPWPHLDLIQSERSMHRLCIGNYLLGWHEKSSKRPVAGKFEKAICRLLRQILCTIDSINSSPAVPVGITLLNSSILAWWLDCGWCGTPNYILRNVNSACTVHFSPVAFDAQWLFKSLNVNIFGHWGALTINDLGAWCWYIQPIRANIEAKNANVDQ